MDGLVSDAECQAQCSGDGNQACGDETKVSVYNGNNFCRNDWQKLNVHFLTMYFSISNDWPCAWN